MARPDASSSSCLPSFMSGQKVAQIIYVLLAIGAAYILGIRIMSGMPITELILPIIVLGFSSYRIITMEIEEHKDESS